MEDAFGHEIAIIALTGRFPGARNLEEFWANLRDGVEAITFFPTEELLSSGVDAALVNDPQYVRAKGMLDRIDLFDAALFGYSPREAEIMDPQQRLFLECSWEALESAGYTSDTYGGRVGVYASASTSTYFLSNLHLNPDLARSGTGTFEIMLGNDKDFLATRVSHKLNLKGPSMTVNTACSSSLVALHLACQSLQSGECDMALVGGVSIIVPQKEGYLYREGGILSPDGHCRAFDAQARGCVGGDGVGVIVLKRLENALADRDYIHAVIKGSAINNDGAVKIGFTAPGEDGQASVIAEALALADIAPETVTYIETHGTGTPLGDPIEVAALTQVFEADTRNKGFCALGSVKTNIGHLAAAAGIAGLIKTVLALEHRQIPPNLHFEHPNPKIRLADGPFYINARLMDWETGSTPRRAGVSSFGIGGTNAHVLLEEAPPLADKGPAPEKRAQVLVLSAQTSSALERATDNLVAHLKQHPDLDLADVAYTLQMGRHVFEYRRVVTCVDLDDAVATLERRDSQRVLTTTQTVLPMLHSPDSQQAEHARPTETLERLWLAGAHIDWPSVHRGEQPRRIPLPAYPFERKSYWIEPQRKGKAGKEEARPIAPAENSEESSPRTSYERPDLQTPYVAPRNEIEQSIAIIWQELLGINQLGIYDNFFELGGNSLLGTQLIARLGEAFKIDVPFQRLFEKASIAGLAEIVEELFCVQMEALSDEEIGSLLSNDSQYH